MGGVKVLNARAALTDGLQRCESSSSDSSPIERLRIDDIIDSALQSESLHQLPALGHLNLKRLEHAGEPGEQAQFEHRAGSELGR